MKKFLLVGLFAVAAANAAITPELLIAGEDGPYCTDGPGAYCTYSYEADLAEKHSVMSGDYFTIYDFNGFVPDSVIGAPAGWTGVAAAVGVNPGDPAIPYPGDGAEWNITWTYQGPTVVGRSGVEFTGFTAVSRFHGIAPGRYGAQTHKPTGQTVPNFPSTSAGYVDVPGPGDGDDVVPEPMSVALLGSGLAALGFLRLRRK